MKRHLSRAASLKFILHPKVKIGMAISAFVLFAQPSFAADVKSTPAGAASAAVHMEAATPPPNSDKLDVSDLEKKYWSAKDTDFSVVQNRAYTKANRWAFAMMYGPMINDSYSDGFTLDLSLQYFVNERSGIEFEYLKSSSKDNSATAAFASAYGTKPDFDRIDSYYGVNYNWVPIYAKMSLMNTKILYFDMAFSPGLGLTQYQQQTINASGSEKSAPTLSLNITQHFFLSNNFAVRGEFQNRWYNEDVVSQNKGLPVRTQLAHDTNLIFGFDYFF